MEECVSGWGQSDGPTYLSPMHTQGITLGIEEMYLT